MRFTKILVLSLFISTCFLALPAITSAAEPISFWSGGEKGLSLPTAAGMERTAAGMADAYVNLYGPAFGLADPENETGRFAQETDELGMRHVSYNQEYQGVPVFGGQLNVHLNDDLSISAANGRLVPGVALDPVPSISEEEALIEAKALCQEQSGITEPEVKKIELYILNKSHMDNNGKDKDYLVWMVSLFQQEPAFNENYFIDAHTGALVWQLTGIKDAVHRHIYDCSYGAYDGNCYMDAMDPWGYIVGRSEGQPARGANPYFYITRPLETDNLYSMTGFNHSYYATKYSRNGANKSGGMGDGSPTYPTAATTGLTYIDYYFNSPDSEWSICPNAFFNGANSIHFCEGEIAHDVVGHEYAHAVNYFSVLSGAGAPAGLTYSNESGALNEGNSDVFGEAVEYYSQGSSDWLFGEDSASGASRSLKNPSSYTYNLGSGNTPYPNRFNDSNYYCGSADNGGVHINSSVPNHGAYLMAAGGTYNGCTISAIGRAKEEAIFYRAQNSYYQTSTDFNEAYGDIIQSCWDLYGHGSTCRQVKKALKSVEMDQGGACSSAAVASPDCAAVDSPAVVSKITSPKKKGHYNAGKKIKVKVHFSKPVTSDGEVKVKFETGKKDRKCRFSITNSTVGSCRYKVKDGDKAKYLKVKKISGTVVDEDGLTITDFTPQRNLPKQKRFVVDTKAPKMPKRLRVYYDFTKSQLMADVDPRIGAYLVRANSAVPRFVWSKGRGGYSPVKYYFVRMSSDDLKRKDVKNKAYRQKSKKFDALLYSPDVENRLYLVMKDKAGNISKLRTLVKYTFTSSP